MKSAAPRTSSRASAEKPASASQSMGSGMRNLGEAAPIINRSRYNIGVDHNARAARRRLQASSPFKAFKEYPSVTSRQSAKAKTTTTSTTTTTTSTEETETDVTETKVEKKAQKKSKKSKKSKVDRR